MSQRLTHRSRRTYNTASNQKEIRRTPGNKLVYIPKKKRGVVPHCIKCDKKLNGIAIARPSELGRMKKSQRTVNRTFGGNLCGRCLSDRILGVFLGGEEKVLKSATVAE